MQQMQDKYRDHYTMHGIIEDEIPEKPVVREPPFVWSSAGRQYIKYLKSVRHTKIVIGGRVYWSPGILD